MARKQRWALFAGFLVAVGGASQALADSWWKYWSDDWFIRLESKLGNLSPDQEREALKFARDKYLAQHPNLKDRLGTLNIGGEGDISTALIGQTVDVRFAFLDPGGPAIAAVRYEVNTDPAMDLALPGSLQLLGISTDAGDGFKIPWTLSGFEPLILATPLDANGNPILTADYVTGDYPPAHPVALRDNISAAIGTVIPIPSPSAAGTAATGLVTVGILTRPTGGRRRRVAT